MSSAAFKVLTADFGSLESITSSSCSSIMERTLVIVELLTGSGYFSKIVNDVLLAIDNTSILLIVPVESPTSNKSPTLRSEVNCVLVPVSVGESILAETVPVNFLVSFGVISATNSLPPVVLAFKPKTECASAIL